MSSNLNRDLAEAYNQIRINEERKYEELLNEYVDYIFSDMVNEGYDITEEEVRQFCLDEGLPGWGLVKSFFGGASKGAAETARRQQVLARAKRIQATRNAAQNAQNLDRINKAGETTGRVLTTLKPGKRSTAAGLALGTGEYALSGQATGDGKSVMANIPGAVVGGLGQAIQGASGATLSKVGYPGLEKIGTEMRRLGNWMSGQAHTPTPGQTQPLPRQVRTERNPYGLQKQSVDLFDLVKGHLLDEGYAETEEAAHAIMSNMSEEWKKNIINKVSEN